MRMTPFWKMGYAFGIKQHTSFSLRNQPFTVPLPSIGRVCLEKSVRVSSTPNLAVLKNPVHIINDSFDFVKQNLAGLEISKAFSVTTDVQRVLVAPLICTFIPSTVAQDGILRYALEISIAGLKTGKWRRRAGLYDLWKIYPTKVS